MGVNLSRRLVERGYDVSVTSRRERPDADGIRYVRGNAKVLAVTGVKQADLTQLVNQLPVELGKWKSHPEAVKIDIMRNAKVNRALGTHMHFVGWRNNLEYVRIRHPLIGRAMRIASAIKRRV